jgi:hypothetical protein
MFYVGLCHHNMTRPRVADGGDSLHIWRVAVNILNKQSRTVNKGLSSCLRDACGDSQQLTVKATC